MRRKRRQHRHDRRQHCQERRRTSRALRRPDASARSCDRARRLALSADPGDQARLQRDDPRAAIALQTRPDLLSRRPYAAGFRSKRSTSSRKKAPIKGRSRRSPTSGQSTRPCSISGVGMDAANVVAHGPGRLETRPDRDQPVERIAIWQDKLIVKNKLGPDNEVLHKIIDLIGNRPCFIDNLQKTSLDSASWIQVWLKPKARCQAGDRGRLVVVSAAAKSGANSRISRHSPRPVWNSQSLISDGERTAGEQTRTNRRNGWRQSSDGATARARRCSSACACQDNDRARAARRRICRGRGRQGSPPARPRRPPMRLRVPATTQTTSGARGSRCRIGPRETATSGTGRGSR